MIENDKLKFNFLTVFKRFSECYKNMLSYHLQQQPPRKFSKISILFFQEHGFLDFSRRLNVFTEKILIFQEGMSVHQTDTNFPGALFLATEKIQILQQSATEQILIFQEGMSVHQTDTNFPGPLFLATGKIQIFQMSATEQILIFQEAFFKYYQTDRQFPGRYPSPL